MFSFSLNNFMARYFFPAGISLVEELMIKTKVVLAADAA